MIRIFLIFSSFLASGCSSCFLNLSTQIFLDSDWNNAEEEAIISGFEAWEKATGAEIFEYAGRYNDDFERQDYNDNRHVFYKATVPNNDTEEIEEDINKRYKTKGVIAFARRRKDMVVLWYNFNAYQMTEDFYLWRLRGIAMHEFGHFLGLGHSDAPESIMNINNKGRQWNWPEPHEITRSDVKQFYKIYKCP